MSFGMLTAVNVDEVPRILRRCAAGYRRGAYARYYATWMMVADEVDKFAADLAVKIAESKKAEPAPRRRRVLL